MTDEGRREFLLKVGVAGLGVAAAPRVVMGAEEAPEAAPVTATEDLMREHGVVARLMTVYQECGERLAAGSAVSPGVFLNAGVIVDSFLQAYHEELEEKHIFPAFVKAGKVTDLVAVLRRQHEVGRALSGRTIFLAGKQNLLEQPTRDELVSLCRSYTRMYRAHMGREDTVLFTAVRDVISPEEFRRLGEAFEETEDEKLGKDGYQHMVGLVADIEKMLGIEDLSTFTPKV